MLKRSALFLLALALSAAAMTTTSHAAPRPACMKPDCFASPGCCKDVECDAWCGGTGFGYCQGVQGNYGGCCVCVG